MSHRLRPIVRDARNSGVTYTACVADRALAVLAGDTGSRKAGRPKAANLPLCGDGLRKLLHAGPRAKRLTFTASCVWVVEFGDEHSPRNPPHPGTRYPYLSQARGYFDDKRHGHVGPVSSLGRGETWNSR